MWKRSRYNVITSFKDKMAMHNLLTNKGILVHKGDLDKLESILATPDKYSDSRVFNKFCEYGFIVNECVDEIMLVEKQKRKVLEEKSKILSLTIIPTYQCNFKCIYCWENTKNSNDGL